MYRKWSTAVLLALLMPITVWAQSTGKLTGRVTDAATGEGLPGANVIIVGTQIGTATDVDGNYTILGVPVGTYDIQATFVGFTGQTYEDVEINSGYTRELNFELNEGQVLQNVVVEYERPLIQRDAIGTPRVVTGEDLQNLPVRGVANVASIQAGVVSEEGSGTLNIRGGRGSEVTYYIDGVKVIGTATLPQSAIEEQEMLIGNISARYGDVMSGVINITTKTGTQRFFGSLEGITSEALDSYGYNLLSATVGGPILGNKVGFFLAGELIDQADNDPRAIGVMQLRDGVLDDLNAAPMAFRAKDAEGNDVFIPIPGTLSSGASFELDHGTFVVSDEGFLVASDGTQIAVPEGVDPSTISTTLVNRAEYLTADQFTTSASIPGNGSRNMSLTGNVTVSPFESIRVRLGGRYRYGEFEDYVSRFDVLFSPNSFRQLERNEGQFYATLTQYLSNTTFYQLQADFSTYTGQGYDPRFGKDFDDFLRYGDISEDAYATLRGYKGAPVTFTEGDVEYVRYNNAYGEAPLIATDIVNGLVTPPGGRVRTYDKFDNQQFRLTGNATTQLGINQLEFGFEYEQQTRRAWSLNPRQLARYVYDDCDANGVCRPDEYIFDAEGDTIRNIQNYDDIPARYIAQFAGYYGFDVFGKEKVDSEDLAGYISTDSYKPVAQRNIAPYQPIYYGGYIQDKLEFRDIVLNVGLRVDVFDNNTRTLRDPFARLPVQRVENLVASGSNNLPGYSRPAGVGDDYAVYFRQGSNEVIGYRDLDGNFYAPSSSGEGVQRVQASEITLNGAPRNLLDNDGVAIRNAIPEMYEDYKPQVTVMPRIGVTFPVTDRANFFARYGVVSQRPSTNQFASLATISSASGTLNNNNLKPEKTTDYEIGFRQRVGDNAAFTVSGFIRQIDNLISRRDILNAFPSVYESYVNVDFGTVKGMELGFDLRRTNNVSVNANYTLSFAQGTGSGAETTSTITWVDETPPNFISPLDFDQRHRANISVDYRLGDGEGPMVFGTRLLENFGVNLLMQAGSGTPYTAITEPYKINASRASNPRGGVNEGRLPGFTRLDLRVDRRFNVAGANLTAFLWVQNLLDSDRVQGVYRATGLPGDDGYLSTAAGQAELAQQTPAFESIYGFRAQTPFNYGIPRMTRIGLRLDF